MSGSSRFLYINGKGQPAAGRGFSAIQPIAFPAPRRKFGPVSSNRMVTKPLLNEPEDAQLTGLTRSLARRLLALNLPGNEPVALQQSQARIA